MNEHVTPPPAPQAAVVALRARFDDLALDFVNTRLRARGGPSDVLATPDGLERWLIAGGVPDARSLLPSSLPGRTILLDEARRLRRAIHEALRAVAEGRTVSPSTVTVLGRALTFSIRIPELDTSGSRPTLGERYEGTHPAAVLTPIALAAARLIERAPRSRLRQCAATGCPRWFLDTSKGGRRRWCSMATCGNRAKAARLRRRRASTAT